MAGSKPAALPLGYAPKLRSNLRRAAEHSASAIWLQPVFAVFHAFSTVRPRKTAGQGNKHAPACQVEAIAMALLRPAKYLAGDKNRGYKSDRTGSGFQGIFAGSEVRLAYPPVRGSVGV